MNNRFFEQPILNSPYDYPARHWELDREGQPTQKIIESRRRAEFITPIPKPKKRKGANAVVLGVRRRLRGFQRRSSSTIHTAIINEVRNQVDKWRTLAQSRMTGR